MVKYYYRLNDFTVFERKQNGNFFIKDSKHHSGTGFKEEILINHRFKPCTEKDFDDLRKKSNVHYKYMSWATRSDGHGGIKGGSIKQFLKKKNVFFDKETNSYYMVADADTLSIYNLKCNEVVENEIESCEKAKSGNCDGSCNYDGAC